MTCFPIFFFILSTSLYVGTKMIPSEYGEKSSCCVVADQIFTAIWNAILLLLMSYLHFSE